jgi:hypothetical protein
MTLDVYAQLQQRVKREHGRAFDTRIDRDGLFEDLAREVLMGRVGAVRGVSANPPAQSRRLRSPVYGGGPGRVASCASDTASRTQAVAISP